MSKKVDEEKNKDRKRLIPTIIIPDVKKGGE